jgi:hypothetical protein
MGKFSYERRGLSITLGVGMSEAQRAGRSATDGYVEFRATGDAVKGEFHCAECGYGVTVHKRLPACPMCGGFAWEQTAWSPLTRAAGGTQAPL